MQGHNKLIEHYTIRAQKSNNIQTLKSRCEKQTAALLLISKAKAWEEHAGEV